MNIKIFKTPEEIALSYEAFLELRPHLTNLSDFVEQVKTQQKEGYKIIGIIENNEVIACIGFRIATMLAWGKILYIDDLITKEKYRRRGYGKILLNHAIQIAKDKECSQVHLDTGYTRHAAHQAYLNEGFEFHCHHLALKLG